ncbi:MFS transporter [Streptomyces boncukensis]|uniref:MFS transporter n=1 Tax=Streptomyces boncukensis TaxID=2711219 RepID=A0A6G4WXN9_9ACTN|nr:MFS transporter [Streptomyces boncukensis]NGO69773.1 MFS transporter [Streptomyces boncukensis]
MPRAGPGHGRWAALAVLALPVLLISVDMTILGFAVPAISAELKPTSGQLLWIVDIYSFLLAGLLVLMGTLGDRIGRRRLLLLGACAFGLASLAAAYATTPELLIVSRALLGLGGATLMPSTLSLIRHIFTERRERRIAIAVWAAAFAAGAGLGPLLGGVLLENFWWGSVFLINLPVMALLLGLGPLLLPESRDPEPGRFDPLSAVLALGATLSFVYGMKRIAEYGPGPLAAVCIVAGIGTGALFALRQRVLSTPLIDIRLFAHRPFSVSVITNLLGIFALVGLLYFFPQYLQMVRGMEPIEAGLWLLPAAATAIAGAGCAALLARRIRLAYLIGAGLALAALGYAATTQLGADSTVAFVVAATALVGAGVGLADTLTNDVIVATAPPGKAGAASAISETAYELGGAMGVAVLGSIASSAYRSELDARLPAAVPPQARDTAHETLGAALETSTQLPPHLAEALAGTAREAFMDGMRLASLVAAALVCCAAVQAALLLRHISPSVTAEEEPHQHGTPSTHGTTRDLHTDPTAGG